VRLTDLSLKSRIKVTGSFIGVYDTDTKGPTSITKARSQPEAAASFLQHSSLVTDSSTVISAGLYTVSSGCVMRGDRQSYARLMRHPRAVEVGRSTFRR